MEDNKKGTRKRIVRRPTEGHAEKVDYSTSRSFDSEDRPRRAYGAGRPQRDSNSRGPRPEGGYSHRPDGEHRSSYGSRPHSDRPYGERPHSDRPRTERSYGDKPAYGEKSYGDRPRRSGYGKPSFGNKPGARKPYAKRSQADEGMKAMLSRKPQVNGRYSDDDTAPTEIQEVVRLNKFIANSGVCSRREADTLIQSGVVTVNGEVVTELGVKVNILLRLPSSQLIR